MCPSATLNHFVYLESQYPDLELRVPPGSSYHDWINRGTELATQMDTLHGGTSAARLFHALYDNVTQAADWH